MGVLILGGNTSYRLFGFFKLFVMVGIGRTPLKQGHFAVSQIYYKFTPEIKTPLSIPDTPPGSQMFTLEGFCCS